VDERSCSLFVAPKEQDILAQGNALGTWRAHRGDSASRINSTQGVALVVTHKFLFAWAIWGR
jgi:hypothetical protein